MCSRTRPIAGRGLARTLQLTEPVPNQLDVTQFLIDFRK
jgi:hypothetical protein